MLELAQPTPFIVGHVGIRRGVNENVAVVESGDQTDAVALEHPVAEHVARHVAHPDDPQRLALSVHPEGTKMPAHRHPRSSGRYRQCFVVITVLPPEAKASPSQKPRSTLMELARSEKCAVPLSGATTR